MKSNKTINIVPSDAAVSNVAAPATSNGRAGRPRGTVLVFVLGVLTLIALVGVGLLASVRGERMRLTMSRSSLVRPPIMDEVIGKVQERLWADLWEDGNTNTANRYLGGKAVTNPTDTVERNEPFDAPGVNDRWLASTIPYLVRDYTAAPPPNYIKDIQVNVGLGNTEQTIAWPRVSYIGSDVVRNRSTVTPINNTFQDFGWPKNSRTGISHLPGTAIYGDGGNYHSLDTYSCYQVHSPTGSGNVMIDTIGGKPIPGIPVILTPPNYATTYPGQTLRRTQIPGATTDITIADANSNWYSDALVPTTPGPGMKAWREGTNISPGHRFPYFDTNMDGVVDLYDADGDGVPDSPLSLALPYPAQRPGDPKNVYVAVRIIDNCSMVNVNTAASRIKPGSSSGAPLFDENSVDLQLRGRRPAEVDLAAVCKPLDKLGTGSDRVMNLTARRWGVPGALTWSYYMNSDKGLTRRQLIGGTYKASPYKPYGLNDEVSLRNRGSLSSQNLAKYDKNQNTGGYLTTDYASVEEALRWTTLWAPQWYVNPMRYEPATARWQRFDNTLGNNTDAGTPSIDWLARPGTKGWKTLYDENAEWFVSRNLLTTMSYASTRLIIPNGFPQPSGVLPATTASLWTSITPITPLFLDPGTGPGVTYRIRTGQINRYNFTEKVDLNPIFRNGAGLIVEPDQVPDQKAAYIGRLATALFMANLRLGWQHDPPRTSTSTISQEAEDIAWQLAVNIVDYADRDDEPTILVDAAGNVKYVGLEAQPFIAKSYCKLDYDFLANNVTNKKTAVELINAFPEFPLPGVTVPTRTAAGMDVTKFALRAVDTSGVGMLAVPLQTNPATTVVIPWMQRGVSLANDVPGRLVVRRDPAITVNPAASTLDPVIPAGADFEIVHNDNLPPGSDFYYKKVELVRRLNTATGIKDWVVDSMDLTTSNTMVTIDGFDVPRSNAMGGSDTGSVANAFVRSDNRARTGGGGFIINSWRFAVDDSTKWTPNTTWGGTVNPGYATPAGGPACTDCTQYGGSATSTKNFPGLGESVESSRSDFAPLQLYFRNTGYARASSGGIWSGAAPFDSVADLENVLAIGTLGTTSRESVPTIIKKNDIRQTSLLDHYPAAGRLDFSDSQDCQPPLPGGKTAQNAGVLFNLLTVSGMNQDDVDNDGDGIIDNADEDQNANGVLDVGEDLNANGKLDVPESRTMMYRSAGMINVNTAPASVLRAIPFMSNASTNAAIQYDMAAAIVAEREKREVQSIFTPRQQATAGNSARPWFETLGQISTIGSNTKPAFWMQRFGNDGIDLVPHDKTVNFWSPDFDAGTNADASAVQIDELRERDVIFSRAAGILTTRSDTFTVYIALIDENGRYLSRSQFTLDRSPCSVQDLPGGTGRKILPSVLGRVDSDYYNDLR